MEATIDTTVFIVQSCSVDVFTIALLVQAKYWLKVYPNSPTIIV
jgi:hypothetical protein